MRPRKTNLGLPSNVYFRHGAHWLVRNKKWTRIPSPHAPKAVVDDLKRRFTYCRAGAIGRKVPFTITEDYVVALADKCGWTCAVTGAPFSLQTMGRSRRKPLGPSIDRIDCAKGYEPGNVRVVCLAVNMAMNEWGEEVLIYLLKYWTGVGSIGQKAA